MLQWMISHAQTELEANPDIITRFHILVGVAGTFSLAYTLSFLFYNLCDNPQYVDELRAEAESCLKESGCWDFPTLEKMKKIESFMCESQRLSPGMILTFNRLVMQPITLSDGFHLPKGTRITMASREIQLDPEVVPEADKFVPFRCYRARKQPGEDIKNRFVTTSSEKLHFGYGTQACSGRQLAQVIVKMIFTSVLMGWDVEYVEGQHRPPSLVVEDFRVSYTGSRRIKMRRRKAIAGMPC
ncbi:cytochrome P450 [Nemania abortiva]|nr:cytochrome P450 [Nemania abortiva]